MRRLAIGLPSTRLTTSGAGGGVVIRPCTGAPFFTAGATMRLVSGFASPLVPTAPCMAPGGIIGIAPMAPLGGVVGADALGGGGDVVCDDAGSVPADGAGRGPSIAVGVVAPRPPPPAPPPPPPSSSAPLLAPSNSPGMASPTAAAPPVPC